MSKSIKSFFAPVTKKAKKGKGEDVCEEKNGEDEEKLSEKCTEDNEESPLSLGKRKIEVISSVRSEDKADILPATAWIPVEQLGSWVPVLRKEFSKTYFHKLDAFLERECASNTVYPPRNLVFSAFNACAFQDIKVVVIGQDPYHGPNQAHGLAFSVMRPERPPPSLKNIFKELKSNYPDFSIPQHGDLSGWSKQGVFMLNTCLTVRRGDANSHQKRGWENFITAVIEAINRREDGVVFLLWGKPASERCIHVNRNKHRLFVSSHPSPLGATKTKAPFIGSKCFLKCNEALSEMGKERIDWSSL